MKRTIPSEMDYSVIRFETELFLQQAPDANNDLFIPGNVCVAEHDGDDVKQRAEGDDDTANKILWIEWLNYSGFC